MERAYYLIGFGVVWGGGSALLLALLWLGWHLRPRNRFTREIADLLEWVAVRIFRKDFDMPIEGARLLFTVDRSRTWPQWKRNILATSIRRAKLNGFRDPYA